MMVHGQDDPSGKDVDPQIWIFEAQLRSIKGARNVPPITIAYEAFVSVDQLLSSDFGRERKFLGARPEAVPVRKDLAKTHEALMQVKLVGFRVRIAIVPGAGAVAPFGKHAEPR